MAYDLATSQLVLFGGAQYAQWQDDTWTYEAGRQAQSITFTSTAPSSASYAGANDQTYAATATATSGLPVTLSVDPSSTSGCTISGGTVSYGSGAGTCVIDANQPGNSSYLPAAQVTQRFTISPAPLSITASSAAMTYGGTVPAITPSYSGFAGNDSPASLSAPPSCSTTATPASPAGTYASACAGAADPNYTISYLPGTVTVDKAATTTTLTAHRDPSARRSPITLTATVTPTASAQTPAGEVDFYAGTPAHHHRLLGTASLTDSGTAVFTATALACARQQLYAVYADSTNDLGSTSATIRSTRCH
jgi:MBG domain (YGX type)/Bacterial Ig-like domain (group 3)